ncbi:EamA family transporter [Brevibacterium sp. CFH 10365]|uniref:EamA family transporter n=1 Tax=Brevibacterium sp. CFH 10365 TaxID=2585207 RepID=UPI00126607B0|nr:EamA family transporter [Brevibacterium sp. CFH 10365]
MSRFPAPLLVLCSVLSVQFGQATGKSLFGSIGPGGVVALRLGLAALVLLLIFRPALPRGRTNVALVIGFGTAIAGMNLVYPAMQYLPLGLATSLQLLGPITLALLTSRRLLDVGLAALAVLGVWLFHSPTGAHYELPGILLALASGASMAAYLLLSRRAGASTIMASPLVWAVTWAAVLTVPIGITASGTALLDARVLGVGLIVAVLAAVLPYSLELVALRRIPPRLVGILQSLEPAAAGLAGAIILTEHLSAPQWLALVCVGAASAGTVAGQRRRRPPVSDRGSRDMAPRWEGKSDDR